MSDAESVAPPSDGGSPGRGVYTAAAILLSVALAVLLVRRATDSALLSDICSSKDPLLLPSLTSTQPAVSA